MTDSEFRDLFSPQSQEIYLDNAASTLKMRCMTEKMADYDMNCGANIARGSYQSARRTEEAVEAAREKIKTFLCAGEDTEVIFTHGTTEGLNLLARSYAPKLKPENNVVTTIAEHHSNLLPWLRVCRQRGAKLRLAEPRVAADAKGNRLVHFWAEDILSFVDENTALVTITGCSNVTGSCLPVREICRAAHKNGLPVIVDGAQLAGHKRADYFGSDYDALCFSAHKLYGPTGLGVICAKKSFLETLEPDVFGGGTVDYVDLKSGTVGWKSGAARWEAGTLPISQILGFSAVLDRLMECGLDNLCAWEDRLRLYLQERMEEIPGIRCIHGGEGGGAIVSICCEFMSSLDLAAMCDAHRIAVRAGKHCAHPFLDFLGESSTLRISLAGYNTVREIDAFAELLRQLQRRFGG